MTDDSKHPVESTEAGRETRTNRLAGSSSPYLLLHQHNPVDWYPWGPEALERARREDKPIFLSVGYSSCYWCHVMERESFSDPKIAERMNRDFVNVKVDREERPELDEIYMAATQILTGQGGWPNSVFLTPDLKPFFAGTYFPPADRYGRPGFRSVLAGVARAWSKQRDQVERESELVAERMREFLQTEISGVAEAPGPEVATRSLAELAARFDPEWGGFGGAPKFPTPSNLFLLLEAAATDPSAARMLTETLDQMARGGLYDQVAGGFHRYATDREWKIPHFEKMLYDNGLLLEVYARTHEIAADPEWERIVVETAAFLDREMSDSGGGFWSAIDAETDAEEGAYYVWTKAELEQALGPDGASELAPMLGFSGSPFFEGNHYVLHLPQSLDRVAADGELSRPELLARLDEARRTLLDVRSTRIRPLTDDKVLTDWNGMVIAGLATSGRVFERPRLVERSARAAEFLLARLWVEPEAGAGKRRLHHVYRQGEVAVPAFLADYAYLVHGLLALHEATEEARWLEAARELVVEQIERLGADPGGYFVAAERDDVLFRSRDPYDGAVPSANGVALWNLIELEKRLDAVEGFDPGAEADRSLRAFGGLVERLPGAARSIALAAARRAGGWEEETPEDRSGPARAQAPLAAEAGAVVEARLEVVEGSPSEIDVVLEIADGWHVNANPASLDELVPTRVEGPEGALTAVEYPPGESFRFAFADEELAVWQGTVRIRGRLGEAGTAGELTLTYQACDDRRCLPPVTRTLGHP